jgi:hypothetical protein
MINLAKKLKMTVTPPIKSHPIPKNDKMRKFEQKTHQTY